MKNKIENLAKYSLFFIGYLILFFFGTSWATGFIYLTKFFY